jgi:RNA polymerase sigma factor (sigma-70 family)
MLRDRTEAEDVTQEAFVRAMQSLGSLQQGKSFRGWIFTIARNSALNRIERRKRVRPLVSSVAGDNNEDYELDIVDPSRFSDPAEAAGSDAVAALVWEAAAGLEPKQYALLDLHVRQGLDSAEIADVRGVTKNNAYVMVNRLKKAVEETIGAYVMMQAGRRSCPTLDAELRQTETTVKGISPKTRKLIDRHIVGCETCQQTKGNLVSPLSLLGAFAPIPLSPEAQSRILGEVMQTWPPATTPEAPPSTDGKPLGQIRRLAQQQPSFVSAALAIAGIVLVLAFAPFGSPTGWLVGENDELAAIVVRLTGSDGTAIEGARLSLYKEGNLESIDTLTTSADGTIHWPDLPPGDYLIAVEVLPDDLVVTGDTIFRPVTLAPGETLDLSGAFKIVASP